MKRCRNPWILCVAAGVDNFDWKKAGDRARHGEAVRSDGSLSMHGYGMDCDLDSFIMIESCKEGTGGGVGVVAVDVGVDVVDADWFD